MPLSVARSNDSWARVVQVIVMIMHVLGDMKAIVWRIIFVPSDFTRKRYRLPFFFFSFIYCPNFEAKL